MNMLEIAHPTRGRTAVILELVAVLGTFVLVREMAAALGAAHAGQYGVVAAVLAATALLRRQGRGWSAVGLARPPGWLRTLGGGVAVYAATVLAIVVLVRPLAGALGLPPLRTEAFEGLRGDLPALLATLVMVWTTVSFGEELLFRGFVQHSLVRMLGPGRLAFATAVLLQAVVFGLLHGSLGTSGMLTAFAVGLLFGAALPLLRGSLWPLIVAHGITDTISLVALYAGVTPA